MTGKTDMVPVLNLPSHLSQPSQSENVPIFGRGTRCYFVPENHDFGANPRKEKRNSQSHRASRPLPTVLPPVGRCVASWGGGGVRIPPAYLGEITTNCYVDIPKIARQVVLDIGYDRAKYGFDGHTCAVIYFSTICKNSSTCIWASWIEIS